jgi:hypothetical protein
MKKLVSGVETINETTNHSSAATGKSTFSFVSTKVSGRTNVPTNATHVEFFNARGERVYYSPPVSALPTQLKANGIVVIRYRLE